MHVRRNHASIWRNADIQETYEWIDKPCIEAIYELILHYNVA
jgi:hypothetical protein